MQYLYMMIIAMLFFSQGDDPYIGQRLQMVESQIERRGVENNAVLDAMRIVPRHRFVPEESRSRAYHDGPVPIGYGQTISQPYIVGYMTAIIEPDSNAKVLEIGTGSGYQAAVCAEIVDEVYTIEIIEELGSAAAKRLDDLDYENIHVKVADGYYGWQEYAPYDAIIVTAAAEYIPPPLVEQLKDGGKMVIPIGSQFMTQTLMLVEKQDGQTKTTNLFPVRFVPFTRN